MLEGNEVEGKIGSGGSYFLDVDDKGMTTVQVNYKEGALDSGMFVKLDVIDLLKMAALKTANSLDDNMVAMISAALGR